MYLYRFGIIPGGCGRMKDIRRDEVKRERNGIIYDGLSI
jgi:hypothetical protein